MKDLQKKPSVANQSEHEVAQHLINKGFRVFNRGWPDFLAIRGEVVLFVEVKRDNQQSTETTGEQDLILSLLGKVFRQEVSAAFMVIRPQDLDHLDLRIRFCEADVKTLNLSASHSFVESPISPEKIH